VDPAAVTSTSLISYSQPAGQPGVPCFASGSNSAPPVLRSLSAQRRRRCCPTQSTRFRHKFGTSVLQVCESAVAKDPEQVVHLGTSGKAATTTGASQPRRAAASPSPAPPLSLSLSLSVSAVSAKGMGKTKSHLNLHSILLFLHRSQGMLPWHLVLEAVQSSHDFLMVPREPRRKPSFGSAFALSGCKSTASWLISAVGLSPRRAGHQEVDARRREQAHDSESVSLYQGECRGREAIRAGIPGVYMNATGSTRQPSQPVPR